MPKQSPAITKRARKFRKTMTLPEVLLWQCLRPSVNKRCKIRRQVPFLDRFVADFYCEKSKLIIEVDGSKHLLREESDRLRDSLLTQLGFQVLRISAKRVLASPSVAAETIIAVALGEMSIDEAQEYW